MALEPMGDSFLTDTVVVHAPSTQGDLDEDYNPITDPGAAGPPIACGLGKGSATGRTGDAEPVSADTWELRTREDPGITAADQVVEWTHHLGVAFAEPEVFSSQGGAEKPSGLGRTWRAYLKRMG